MRKHRQVRQRSALPRHLRARQEGDQPEVVEQERKALGHGMHHLQHPAEVPVLPQQAIVRLIEILYRMIWLNLAKFSLTLVIDYYVYVVMQL